MPLLKDVARYVRSKNAGPFWVTIDIFFETEEALKAAVGAKALQPEAISKLYGADAELVRAFPNAAQKVLKISFPRPIVAGSFRDPDAHAGQYYVPLLSQPVD